MWNTHRIDMQTQECIHNNNQQTQELGYNADTDDMDGDYIMDLSTFQNEDANNQHHHVRRSSSIINENIDSTFDIKDDDEYQLQIQDEDEDEDEDDDDNIDSQFANRPYQQVKTVKFFIYIKHTQHKK